MSKPYVIALEEHYSDPAVVNRSGDGAGAMRPGGFMSFLAGRIEDLGEVRLAEMDRAGIDLQVISHTPSPIQQVGAAEAVELARATNDRLHDAVDRHADRFAAFAALPTPDPRSAP